jgi:hypothetical protein
MSGNGGRDNFDVGYDASRRRWHRLCRTFSWRWLHATRRTDFSRPCGAMSTELAARTMSGAVLHKPSLGVGVISQLMNEHVGVRVKDVGSYCHRRSPLLNRLQSLYSVTKGQSAIRDLFAVKHDRTGNLPPLPAIFPDQLATIVRVGARGERELVMARWGMPGPTHFGGQPVTNIRNLKSPHWRRWLGPGSRCVVPATSFCEYADTKPRKTPIWFALAEERPLFAFLGYGRRGRACVGPRARRLKATTSCLVS